MSQKFSRLEITDICDELNEDLRRELIERQVICVSKLDSNRNEINELKNDIKRLESDLKFANKCLITLNKFKKYLNEIRPQIENVLDLRQKQELNALENEYKFMIKKVNERLRSISSDNGSDSEIRNEGMVNNIESDHNYFIKEEIPETNEYSNTEECMAGLLQCDYFGCQRTFNFTEDLRKHRKSCHSLERDQSSNHFENIDPNDNNSNDSNYEPINEDNNSSSDEEITNKSLKRRVYKIEKPLSCFYPNCGFVGKTNSELKNHKRIHINTGLNPYLCDWPECQFVGETYKKLYHHKYMHRYRSHRSHKSGAENFKCKLCDYRWKYESDLKNHMNAKHTTFKCSYADCGMGFTTSYQRTIHIKRIHKSVPKYECDDCPYVAISRYRLERHQKVHRDWFKCDWPECGFYGRSRDKLKIHVYRHTGVRPFPCTWPECGQSFHIKASLNRHLRGHNNKENPSNPSNDTNDGNNTKDSLREKELTFCCSVKGCDKSFSKNTQLNRHLLYSRNHFEFDPKLKLKCNECPFRCDSQKWMRFHMRVHSNETFECQFCEKQFKVKASLKKHLRKVHSFVQTLKCTVEGCLKEFTSDYKRSQHLCRDHKIVKTFQCDYIGCGFVAKEKRDIEEHKNLHTGRVPFACDYVGCGYVGKNCKQLNSHKRDNHSIAVLYHCDVCDYSHKQKREVKRHKIMKHTIDTPFKCDYCVKQFKIEAHLNNHIKRMHMAVPLQLNCTYDGCDEVFDTKLKRWKHIQVVHTKRHRCDWPDCDFIAVCRSKLVQHKYIHTGDSPHVCDWPDCGFIARSKEILKHHRYRHTGERPYPCTWPGCGKCFRTESAFSTHMRWHKKDLCYSCEWPGCEFATHDRSHLRNHRFSHQKNMTAKTKTNKRLKVVIKSNNNLIKKSINKRNVRKPKRYETESESESVSNSDSGSDNYKYI